MIVIFPIGGKGDRFVKAGYSVPKPFILLQGKPLLAHALESYPKDLWHFFFVRPEYKASVEEATQHLKYKGVYTVPIETRGPVETILYGLTQLPTDLSDELLFADCDSALNPKELEEAIDLFRTSGADGGVTTRVTDDLGCSFCRIDADSWVLETKEKDNSFEVDMVSKHSTTGPYWWKDADTFLTCVYKAQANGVTSLSPVYNYLIQQGGRVKAFPVSSFRHFGTPESLEKFSLKQPAHEA